MSRRPLGRLVSAAAVAGLIGLTLPAGMAAQSPGPAAELLGTWRGPFATEGPSGTMNLTVAWDGADYEVTSDVQGEGVPPGGEVREWRVEGTVFSFAQAFGEYEVLFRGELVEGTLRGTIEAYQYGTLVITGTFTLARP